MPNTLWHVWRRGCHRLNWAFGTVARATPRLCLKLLHDNRVRDHTRSGHLRRHAQPCSRPPRLEADRGGHGRAQLLLTSTGRSWTSSAEIVAVARALGAARARPARDSTGMRPAPALLVVGWAAPTGCASLDCGGRRSTVAFCMRSSNAKTVCGHLAYIVIISRERKGDVARDTHHLSEVRLDGDDVPTDQDKPDQLEAVCPRGHARPLRWCKQITILSPPSIDECKAQSSRMGSGSGVRLGWPVIAVVT